MAFGKLRFLLLSFMIIAFCGTAQTGGGTADKVKNKINIQQANSAFMNMAYEEAITYYRKVQEKDPKNSFLNYRIGFCHLELKELDLAIESFELVKANQLKKKYFDFYYAYGRAFHLQGKFNSALTQYQLFEKNARKKDLKYYEVDRFIKQCTYALKGIETPVSVQIDNIGDYVNSAYDDYHPIVTIDGKSLFFTSRKRNDKNNELLGDNQYFENVYQSKWNEEDANWDEAEVIKGKINAKNEYTANTGVAPDGKKLLVYRNSKELNKKVLSPVGAGDILISKMGKNGLWGRPKVIEGINSEYYDGGACFSPDGNKIYFISDRRGLMHGKSVGQKDIWVSEIQEDKTWGKPINLGNVVNTDVNEISVFMHPNGKTLFFSSEGHYDKSYGGYDVFKTELQKDGTWSTPVNLGFPINTANNEKEFVLSADGKTGWISAQKQLDNKVDIFQIDLSFYDVITGQNDPLSIVKGTVKDASTEMTLPCKIKFTNNATNEVTEVSSNENGEYLTPIISNTTYTVSVAKEAYKNFSEQLSIALPPKPRKKKKRRKKRGEKEKGVTTAEIHSIVFNFKLAPSNPLNIVSADLFKVQTVRFEQDSAGHVISDFSKDILNTCAKQLVSEPRIKLTVTAHFDDDNNDYDVSLGESAKLGKLVSDYLRARGASLENVEVFPMGNNEPMADTDTKKGKLINRRVELRFSL